MKKLNLPGVCQLPQGTVFFNNGCTFLILEDMEMDVAYARQDHKQWSVRLKGTKTPPNPEHVYNITEGKFVDSIAFSAIKPGMIILEYKKEDN